MVESNKQLYLGQEVLVKAWWTNPEGKTVRCRVVELWKSNEKFITVEPLEGGNRHKRMLDVKKITQA